ncbi:helix-turn-helix domain-containing protein [Streptomyces sp. NPDC001817]|uniref:helix-turn-helix domain-containing protein n=1 Tax=Streptomyces sp. NPDC001817 TaxID=3154398 RepID=UPI003321E2C6
MNNRSTRANWRLCRGCWGTATIRHTLQVFLANAGSLRPTADRLVVHKNTVTYRVRKAKECWGDRSIRTGSEWNWRCWRVTGWGRLCSHPTRRSRRTSDG